MLPLPILLPILVTIFILIAHLWADLHICPPFPLPLPHRPAQTCLSMQQPTNQTRMHQGISQHLNHAYQAFLPGQLFLSDLKPLLMQLKVCAPQLICLTHDFHALAFPTHAQTHNTASSLQVVTGGSVMGAIALLFLAATGRVRVSAFGLVTRKP